MTFRAQYDGVCGDCSEPIRRGQECTYLGDAVVHAVCPEPPKICPTCFVQLPVSGRCDTCD